MRDPLEIEGWMSQEELAWLSQQARKYQTITEIGSWKGRSTAALLRDCPGTVIAVDHFKGSPGELASTHKEATEHDIYQDFLDNVGDAENLEIMRMDSLAASLNLEPKSQEMVFIDGDHDYEAVKADISAWLPKCSKLLCGHDSNWHGVRRALSDLNLEWFHGPGAIWFVDLLAKTNGDGLKPMRHSLASPKGIAVAMISGRGSCPVEMVPALSLQSWPTNTNITFATVYGMETDQGRINAVLKAREEGLKYIWFIDDDTVPPPDAGRQLLYTLEQKGPPHGKAMVAAGIYVTRSSPPEPLVFTEQGAGPHWNWKVGDVFRVWGAGTGCMMVNLEVFDHIPEPWFKTTMESHYRESDDLYFCDKVAKAGFEVWANGKVLCHHYDMERGTVYMLPRESYPYKQRVEGEFREPILIGS